MNRARHLAPHPFVQRANLLRIVGAATVLVAISALAITSNTDFADANSTPGSDTGTVLSAGDGNNPNGVGLTTGRIPPIQINGGICDGTKGMGTSTAGIPIILHWDTSGVAANRIDHYEVTLSVTAAASTYPGTSTPLKDNSTGYSAVNTDWAGIAWQDNSKNGNWMVTASGSNPAANISQASSGTMMWNNAFSVHGAPGDSGMTWLPPNIAGTPSGVQQTATTGPVAGGMSSPLPPNGPGQSTTYILNNRITGVAWGFNIYGATHNVNGRVDVVAVGPGGWRSAVTSAVWWVGNGYTTPGLFNIPPASNLTSSACAMIYPK